MMLHLVAMYGLAYILKESDIFAPARQWIMQRSVFITKLLWCWYCVGFWSGVFIYLLDSASSKGFESFNPFDLIIWGCAGSVASALGNAVMERLSWQRADIEPTKENKSGV